LRVGFPNKKKIVLYGIYRHWKRVHKISRLSEAKQKVTFTKLLTQFKVVEKILTKFLYLVT